MSFPDKTNSIVALEIRNGSTGTYGEKRVMAILIRDRASGQAIVEVPITADQFMAALAGTYHGKMPAWVVPPEYRMRIGLKSVHTTVQLGDDDVSIRKEIETIMKAKNPKGYTSTLTRDDVEPGSTLDIWILDQMQHEGWQTWNLTRHNYGWALHLTKYVDPSEVETPDWDKD